MPLSAAVILATGFRSDNGPPVALTPLSGLPAIGHVLRALAGVRRLVNLQRDVYVVVNESDLHLFQGPLARLPGDIALLPSQIISNGCSSPETWNGEVCDLQLALRMISSTGASAQGGHVLVLSQLLTFGPGYSLQRVVEHSLLRAKDTVGFSTLTPADTAVLGNEGHTAVSPADAVPLPPLRALTPASFAYEGDDVAEPLLVLRPATLDAVLASTAADLAGLAAELLAGGTELCGVDLQAGRLRLQSTAALDYAVKYVEYLTAHPAAPMGDAAAAVSEGAVAQQLTATTRDFNTKHFGPDLTGKSSHTGKFYTLPSTFYMTQTRRQYATVMR